MRRAPPGSTSCARRVNQHTIIVRGGTLVEDREVANVCARRTRGEFGQRRAADIKRIDVTGWTEKLCELQCFASRAGARIKPAPGGLNTDGLEKKLRAEILDLDEPVIERCRF